ncbi:AAA domain-containing protein, partial [candidate division WOR-3 bacterium]|nr:AAA domain-containing protein [candidate division WOR-3 bacterium]MBD3363720.1 AAA domain-containing protein [candidate division WOR-3 bacterium]
ALVYGGKIEEGLGILIECSEVFKGRENLYGYARSLYEIARTMFNHKGYSREADQALEEAVGVFCRLGAERDIESIERFKIDNFANWRNENGLSQAYLSGLKRISELINDRLGEENYMMQLLTMVLELTGAERGMIFFADKAQLYSAASKRMDSATTKDARRISQTVVMQVKRSLTSIYTEDATKDERFSNSQSILLNNIRSILCIPLKTGSRLIGTIYLDSQIPGLFEKDKIIYFEALGNLLAATTDKSLEFQKLREEINLTRRRGKWQESGIVLGSSPAMKELDRQLAQATLTETNVLLEGETGTGKGVFARLIHEQSSRKDRHFCSINCGILPEGLLESELFGAQKGSYSGSVSDRVGLIEAAEGSTVFLDEITNISLTTQGKLLEVIEERVIRRLGETKKRKVNVRFVFATNRNLKKEVRDGNFREDLFFRLATLRIHIPPLRDRKEDIPEFVEFFLRKFSSELNKDVTEVTPDAMQALINYNWPGNVRELSNVIERAVLLAKVPQINPRLLDQRFWPQKTPKLKDIRTLEEKELIRQTLRATNGNVSQAARHLDITRQHLTRLMSRYGISRKFRPTH